MGDNRPTKKQFELLAYIDGFIRGNGYGPSYREIMRALDYKSVSTVAVHVDGLIAGGHLRKRTRSARSLEVVKTSGNTVEKPVKSEDNHAWIVDKATKAVEAYHIVQTPAARQDADTLVQALRVLDIADHARLHQMLITPPLDEIRSKEV